MPIERTEFEGRLGADLEDCWPARPRLLRLQAECRGSQGSCEKRRRGGARVRLVRVSILEWCIEMLGPREESPAAAPQRAVSGPGRSAPRGTLRAHNQVAALQYVTVTNAPTYRAIVEVVFTARHHY